MQAAQAQAIDLSMHAYQPQQSPFNEEAAELELIRCDLELSLLNMSRSSDFEYTQKLMRLQAAVWHKYKTTNKLRFKCEYHNLRRQIEVKSKTLDHLDDEIAGKQLEANLFREQIANRAAKRKRAQMEEDDRPSTSSSSSSSSSSASSSFSSSSGFNADASSYVFDCSLDNMNINVNVNSDELTELDSIFLYLSDSDDDEEPMLPEP